jgi:hypothetical protein
MEMQDHPDSFHAKRINIVLPESKAAAGWCAAIRDQEK